MNAKLVSLMADLMEEKTWPDNGLGNEMTG
jgi:hypothetical protein